MAINTYALLQSSVRNFMHRSTILGADDATDIVPDLIILGETRIFRDVRHRTMEQPLSSVIASGVIAVPSDYVALKQAYVDGTPVVPLQRRTVEFIYTRFPTRSSTAKPAFIARESSSFIFGPFPDSGYTIKGTYYRRLTAVSISANALFIEAPDVYLFAALAETRAFVEEENPMIALWESKYQAALKSLNMEDGIEDKSGSAPTMKPDIRLTDSARR